MDISPACQSFTYPKLNVSVHIQNDTLFEGDETFCAKLAILDNDGMVMIRETHQRAKITILDDDGEYLS